MLQRMANSKVMTRSELCACFKLKHWQSWQARGVDVGTASLPPAWVSSRSRDPAGGKSAPGLAVQLQQRHPVTARAPHRPQTASSL